MTFTEEARQLIEKWERFEPKAYADEGGVWTIGYGHTGPDVLPGLVWTQEQADLQLGRDLGHFIDGVKKLILRRCVLTDEQFSALVIFAFNIGLAEFSTSTALRRVNMCALLDVPDAMRLFNKVHDRRTGQLVISKGLIARRENEIKLWNK